MKRYAVVNKALELVEQEFETREEAKEYIRHSGRTKYFLSIVLIEYR